MKKLFASVCLLCLFFLFSCNEVKNKEGHNHDFCDHEHESINKTDSYKLGFDSSSLNYIDSYLYLKNALVNDDDDFARKAAERLVRNANLLKNIDLRDNDSSEVNQKITEIVAASQRIAENRSSIKMQREFFSNLDIHIQELLQILGTDRVLYEQYCPMYKGIGASWLSDTNIIENPYYGEEMRFCGSVRKVIK